MKFIIALLLWFILLAVCWPLAVIVFFFGVLGILLVFPFIILGYTLAGVFALIKAILLFPFKVFKLA